MSHLVTDGHTYGHVNIVLEFCVKCEQNSQKYLLKNLNQPISAEDPRIQCQGRRINCWPEGWKPRPCLSIGIGNTFLVKHTNFQIIIDNFSYTGKAPDAFFYVGTTGLVVNQTKILAKKIHHDQHLGVPARRAS